VRHALYQTARREKSAYMTYPAITPTLLPREER
jgi:hypothetical protein